jgi:Gram-negative bacterial TonB protein C-terminal
MLYKPPLPLDNIKVAAPCNAEWRFMYGSDRVRFCGQCSKNVYNLSAMTREDAEDLIRRTEGQLCVRFYRREDGTVLTSNCPVGVKALRDKLKRASTGIIAVLLGLFTYLGVSWLGNRGEDLGVFPAVIGPRILLRPPLMGEIALPDSDPPIVKRSEGFIRNRAVLTVSPGYFDGSSRTSEDVVVRIFIGVDGEVDGAVSVSGRPQHRQLAKEAADRWKFEPLVVNGRPARVESNLTFHFRS